MCPACVIISSMFPELCMICFFLFCLFCPACYHVRNVLVCVSGCAMICCVLFCVSGCCMDCPVCVWFDYVYVWTVLFPECIFIVVPECVSVCMWLSSLLYNVCCVFTDCVIIISLRSVLSFPGVFHMFCPERFTMFWNVHHVWNALSECIMMCVFVCFVRNGTCFVCLFFA